MSLMEINL